MSTKPLVLPNLIRMKKVDPGVYEDLVKMQDQLNIVHKALGGQSTPTATGGMSVSATNGVIDISIIDKNPQQGEDYFLEYDTSPSFENAHGIGPIAPRNYRNSTLAGQTTYWRWYKSTKLGGISNRIAFGNPPTAVTPGQLSTVAAGPTPSKTQGSGQSQVPGYGYGSVNKAGFRKVDTL